MLKSNVNWINSLMVFSGDSHTHCCAAIDLIYYNAMHVTETASVNCVIVALVIMLFSAY